MATHELLRQLIRRRVGCIYRYVHTSVHKVPVFGHVGVYMSIKSLFFDTIN